jgi:hypothetical protein
MEVRETDGTENKMCMLCREKRGGGVLPLGYRLCGCLNLSSKKKGETQQGPRSYNL